MNLLVLSLASLIGATPVVLEPKLPAEFHRLHPRRVLASSFLKNGWNKFEQNYLPPYVADDDPATAWVEGVDGKGEGESLLWIGPTLHKAREYRVFIRNGYQKSKALYLANARPRAISLEPLRTSEAGWIAAGNPVQFELADVAGWQEVRVPTQPEVAAVRLSLKTVYPGKAYEDTCISDLRVYVAGEDAYEPAAEQRAMEAIRRFVADRRRAATLGDTGQVALAPRYKQVAHEQQESSRAPSASEPLAPFKAASEPADFAVANASLTLFNSLDLNAHPSVPADWKPVQVVGVHPPLGAAEVSFGDLDDDSLVAAAGLFHADDLAAFERHSDPKEVAARIGRLRKVEARARKQCVASCAESRKAQGQEGYDCTCEEECSGECGGGGGLSAAETAEAKKRDGDYLTGSLDSPRYLLRASTGIMGEREVMIRFQQLLVAYEGNLAKVVVTSSAMNGGEARNVFVHVLHWKKQDGKDFLAEVVTYNPSSAQMWKYAASI